MYFCVITQKLGISYTRNAINQAPPLCDIIQYLQVWPLVIFVKSVITKLNNFQKVQYLFVNFSKQYFAQNDWKYQVSMKTIPIKYADACRFHYQYQLLSINVKLVTFTFVSKSLVINGAMRSIQPSVNCCQFNILLNLRSPDFQLTIYIIGILNNGV